MLDTSRSVERDGWTVRPRGTRAEGQVVGKARDFNVESWDVESCLTNRVVEKLNGKGQPHIRRCKENEKLQLDAFVLPERTE